MGDAGGVGRTICHVNAFYARRLSDIEVERWYKHIDSLIADRGKIKTTSQRVQLMRQALETEEDRMFKPKVQLTNGDPVPEDRSHEELRTDGQQKGYVILSPEERAKGFVKPVRRSYRHIGAPAAPTNLRELTEEEHARYDKYGYAMYETYAEDKSPVAGKFWTRAELARAGTTCGAVTTMALSIAETYARDPEFYSGTFCCVCAAHYPLEEFVWLPDGEPMDPRKQAA